MEEEHDLKQKTARTLKWNTIDKFASQVFYGITGVVLANLLSKEDFGLVGAMLVFQAFASLFVDSGFSAALIQKKSPTESDYCTVFYFNLGISIAIYIVLWACAPLIADLFGDARLVSLSRVMFLSFIINATALVQTNRMMKQMTMARVAVANSLGLVVSGIAGIWLAVEGYGAWAIVWQTVILAAVKSGFLWVTTGWVPRCGFSMDSLRSVFSVGFGVMVCSFLNTVSLNVYSLIIGAYYNLAKLGCYTQADKWSKMGIQSLSQIMTASFLPVLSGFQDDRERLLRSMRKMNRFTAYLVLPIFLLLITAAEPIFHILFSTKWDDAILLFQILMARGIFIVLATNYNNFILGLGRSRALVGYETVKDVLMVAAIVVTIPMGITAMIWGQFAASLLFYVYAIFKAGHVAGYAPRLIFGDVLPYAVIATVVAVPQWLVLHAVANPWLSILAQTAVCFTLYYLANRWLNSTIQKEVLTFALGRFRRKKNVAADEDDNQ